MATAVCFHLTRGHTGFEANENNPHSRSCACRAAAKVRAHRGLMLQHTVATSILGAVWSPAVQTRGQPAQQTLEIRFFPGYSDGFPAGLKLRFHGETRLTGKVRPNYI